jgi:ankyrin repeat protein
MGIIRHIIFVLFLSFVTHQMGLTQGKVLIQPDTVYIYSDPDFELMMAAIDGDTAKLKAFLELGADPNYQTYQGVTPLMFAAQEGHLGSVEILIDSGANVNLLPESKVSALLGATIAGHVFVADTLILNGANVNTGNLNGVNPLMAAAAYNYPLLVDVLLFYGAEVNAKDEKGNTALHFSTYYNNLEISNLLIEKGSDVNAKDADGFTPLMLAAQNGYQEMVEMLILNGADLYITNDNNLNALSLAIVNRNNDIVQYLLENGADMNRSISPKINQMTLAREYGDNTTRQILESYGGKMKGKFRFDEMSLGLDLNGTSNDFMMGTNLKLNESNFRISVVGGYKTRPWSRSVEIPTDDPNIVYQFWETRSMIHLGIDKFFLLHRASYTRYGGLFVGLNGVYTYGNFRGSERKPEDKILPSPKAGFYWIFKQGYVTLNYEYLKLNNSKASPNRINFSIGFNFGMSKTKITLKGEPEI